MKANCTVLVVESDENDQLLILGALKALELASTIRVVKDGAAAIAYLMGEGKHADREQHPYPTLIMTDLGLPCADGFAVLEHLKANPAWGIIPTIVLSGSTDPDDIKKSYMLGASAYHCKPASFRELRRLIKAIHNYWITCEIPVVDSSGKQLHTNSNGRRGERFPQSSQTVQTRA